MDFLTLAFNTILYKPLFNSLVFLYEYLPGHDFGVAIILLTCAIRLLLYPSTLKSIRSQKVLQELQPKIKEIQDKFKNDKAQQGKAMMDLYKEEKINPMSGCLPMLLQLPILIALFMVLRSLAGGLDVINGDLLYSFVSNPGQINPMFLGIMDLTIPSPVLAIVAGVSQFVQAKMMSSQTKKTEKKGGDFSQLMQKQMLYFFPIFAVLILWKLPSAIGLYWVTTTIFSIAQQRLAFKKQTCLPIEK